jgi:hypothetical protein
MRERRAERAQKTRRNRTRRFCATFGTVSCSSTVLEELHLQLWLITPPSIEAMSRKCQFTLPDSLYDRLVAESLRTGRSQAEYARRGLEAILPRDDRRARIRGYEVAVFVRRLPGVLRKIHPRLSD